MRSSWVAGVLGLCVVCVVALPASRAQEVPRVDPAWVLEDRDKRVVHSVPGMDQVAVRTDIVYREAGPAALKMDVYSPRGRATGARVPVVVLVHGGWLPANLLTEPKEWGQFRSLGRLLAASGLVAVTFNHRYYTSANSLPDAESDLLALVEYVRDRAGSLGVDPDRVALWTFSGSGLLLTHALRVSPPHVRAVVAYYAALGLDEFARARPGAVTDAVLQAFSPLRVLATREPGDRPAPPILVVRAGQDRPEINGPMDEFVSAAMRHNADIEVINHPAGGHGFDISDDTDRSRLVIQRTIAFLRARLEGR